MEGFEVNPDYFDPVALSRAVLLLKSVVASIQTHNTFPQDMVNLLEACDLIQRFSLDPRTIKTPEQQLFQTLAQELYSACLNICLPFVNNKQGTPSLEFIFGEIKMRFYFLKEGEVLFGEESR